MLILHALGERGSGLFLLLIAGLLGGAIRSLCAIPGQGLVMAMLCVVATLTVLVGIDFLLRCPVLNWLHRRLS